MEAAAQPYRLEVAVKRVYGLTPLIASTASKIAVDVHFLDFPTIVIHPQGFTVGDAVTYNVCHKADFRMAPEHAANVFPALCQCNLSTENDAALSSTARWACPCPLLPGAQQQQQQRTYVNCVIRNTAGETLGYAEMCCVVLALAPPPPPPHAPSPPPGAAMTMGPSASFAPLSAAPRTPPPLSAPRADPPRAAAEGEHGKPYIVRVVVGESDRGRRRGAGGGGYLARGETESDTMDSRELAAVRAGGRHGSPPRHASANTASKESLLYVLQYDVAYQLQSLSETTAAVLQREHAVLSGVSLSSSSKDGSVSISKLTKSIDRSVAQMVKLANIILQVANQLIDKSPAPARTGTSREIKEMARQKRNPVNALPVPADNSVGHYLQYDVLYQLQCLGTNLSYFTLAYREVLDIAISAIPAQHADFCTRLGGEVQHLTKLLNILVQSSVDGSYGVVAAPAADASKTNGKAKKSTKSKHHDAAAKTKASARVLSVGDARSSRSSSSSSTYSSFTDSSSSDSSSLSSSDSSLNRPLTPISAPANPVAVSVVPVTPPNPPVQSLPSQHLQPASQAYVTPVSIPTVAPPPPPPQISPPPYAMVAATSSPVAASLSATESPPQERSKSFLSVPGASPFSWVNAMHQEQRNAPSPPPLSTSITPMTSGVYGTTGTSFTSQPVAPTAVPPALSAPQLSVAPPRLSLPSPLAPPTAVTSPASHTAPKPAAATLAPPPLAPPALPIPVPLPR